MSGSVSDYIARLEQQLRQRGIIDPRILAEAREHLVDAIEEGREQGLSAADAEHEAFERFGAPEIVAAHILEEGDRGTGIAGAFGAIWRQKWWILVPTVLVAVVTGVASEYFQPVRYQSQTTILVVRQRLPEDYVRPSVTTTIEDRLRTINQQVRSRTRLERIIDDVNLYPERRKKDGMQDIVDDMSDDIHVEILQPDVFRVAFISDNPRTAMQVTERLATYFVDESLKDRTTLAEGAAEFLETQIADVRRQILELEEDLNKADARNGDRAVSQADVIPYEILKENYKALLLKRADARLSANLERRQIGEQFRILDPARLPEQPVGPNRVRLALTGALVGLAIGLVLVVLRRSSNTRPPALAEA
jgi:uncharacterized protein involved in exopolysaccharide biosynthesis